METELEKSKTSTFERFFYWFLMPALFITILALIYLYVFDEPFKEKMHKAAAAIPFVGAWFEEPEETEEGGVTAELEEEPADELAGLQEEMQAQEARLAELQVELSTKEAEMAELLDELAALTEQQLQTVADDEEYREQIKETSSLYARMMPSKAAVIMESLTASERVLFLNEMRTDARSKILEKMSPELAAEATVGLKDLLSAKDVQIAALQERLQLMEEADAPSSNVALKDDELGATFASMAPKQAAAILLAMNATHPRKVLDILHTTTNEARSRIVAAMSEEDNSQTAAIIANLAQ